MSRSPHCSAHAWGLLAQACGLVAVSLTAACSDSAIGPRTPSSTAMNTSAARLIMVTPTGALRGAGTTSAPMSLAMAIASAPAGSKIQLAGGTYEIAGLTIDRPLTLEAAAGAAVDIKGSAVIPADQWERIGALWRTPWTAATLAPAAAAPTDSSPTASMRADAVRRVTQLQHRLSAGAHVLTPAASLATVDQSSFYVDSIGKWLYVGQDPALNPVQTGTAGIGILVTGPNVQVGHISVHDFADIGFRVASSGAVIQSNNFSHNGLIGLDINGVSNVTVQHNTITYNGQVGIEMSYSSNLLIQYNNISNNNTGNYSMSYAAAGMKGTNVSNVMVQGNWVADNQANSIWFDVNSAGITIAANQVMRSKAYGIYFELTNGPLIVGNVAHDNHQAGIGVHFTTNARIYNNTLVNNGTDLDVSASYARAPYDTYNAVIANNIFWNSTSSMLVNLYRYNGCNSWVYSEVDYNAYYRPSGSPARYVVNWCNAWETNITPFRTTGNESHGMEYDGGSDPFFVNVAGGNYHIHAGSPAIGRGQGLPSDAAAALGVKAGTAVNLGALQWVQ